MENEIFERDYTEQDADDYSFQRREIDNDFYQYIINSEAVREFDKKFKQLPRAINLKEQQIYNELLRDLNVYARKNGGIIKGVVDYTHWDAHIYVTLPKFEFFNEHLNFLITTAQKSHGIGLTVTDDGRIKLTVKVDYFEELEDVNLLIQELYQSDPQLTDLVNESRKAQEIEVRNLPHVKAFLQNNADATGLTPDEVFDRLMDIIENEPERVEKWLKDNEKRKNKLFFNPQNDEDNKNIKE